MYTYSHFFYILGSVFVYRTEHSILFVPGAHYCIPRYTLHTGIIILSFVAHNHGHAETQSIVASLPGWR